MSEAFMNGPKVKTPQGIMCGIFNVTPPAPVDGQSVPFQMDTEGNLLVNVVHGGGGSSNPAAGPTGSPVPADADYIGVNIGGVLTGVTGFSLTSTKAAAVAIVDASGNQITSFGGGTQFADNSASGATPTGTLAMGWDSVNSKIRALKVDTSQNLLVDLATALPAGTNVIGHVVVDSGAITVSGTVSATQGTSPWVISFTAPQHVIVDSGSLSVTQGTSPWVISFTAPQHVIVDSGSITVSGTVSISGTVGVTQSTSPWVISFTAPQHVIVDSGSLSVTQGTSPWVTADQADVAGGGTTPPTKVLMVGGKTNDGTPQYDILPLGTGGRTVIIEGFAGGTAVPVSGSISFASPQHVIVDSGSITVSGTVSISGTVGVTQSTSPWVISFTAPQHVIVDSGTIAVTQSTSPWVTSDQADVVGGGTIAPSKVLMVGGKTNDGSPQYDFMPLGAGGRTVIIEGFAGGTAVPISGAVSFTAPQHVIVDSGTVSATQGTSPWVISFTAPQHVIVDSGTVSITGTVGVTQSTSPWVISFTAPQHVIVDSGTIAATQSGTWNVNQLIGVAGFEKITDGSNTAAVKAASTAPVATDPALVVAISPNTPTLPVSISSPSISDVPVQVGLLGDNIVIPAPTGGKSIFVTAWNLSFSGFVNAELSEPSSPNGQFNGLFDSQIPDSGIFDDEFPALAIFDAGLGLPKAAAVVKAGPYYGSASSGVGQTSSLPGYLWKGTANTALSVNLSAAVLVGGAISYYIA